MRIVAGKHRGFRLAALPGAALRPTADRVREALFNILAHGRWRRAGGGLAGARVVDVFAGTGALGLEALSRGARHVTFIDDSAAACALIRDNAATLGVGDQATVLERDATRLGPAPARHALALLDPPYRSGLAAPALDALAAQGWLEAGAQAVVELAKREPFAPPDGFETLDERVYGRTRLVILGFKAGTRGG